MLSDIQLSAAEDTETMQWGDARRTFESMMWLIRR